jgi:hypothetical protein
MRSKFSSLLLTGKAATLPLLISNAHALTPSYADVVSSKLSQVQLPEASQIQLNSLGSGTYDGSAVICSDARTMSNKMSIVLTGLQDQDTVYLVTSTDLGGNQTLNPNLKIGTKNLLVASALGVRAAGSTNVSVSVSLDLDRLRAQGYTLTKGSKFYMQTIVFPASALLTGINWTQAKLSEVDVVSVDACAPVNPYGTYGSY